MKSLRIYRSLVKRIFRKSKTLKTYTPLLFTRASIYIPLQTLEVQDGHKGFKPEVNGFASRQISGFQYLNPNSQIDTSFLEIDSNISTEKELSEEEIFEGEC